MENLSYDELQEILSRPPELKRDPYSIDIRHGKHKGKTIGEMLESRDGISYLQWMKEATKSTYMKEAIGAAFEKKLAETKAVETKAKEKLRKK